MLVSGNDEFAFLEPVFQGEEDLGRSSEAIRDYLRERLGSKQFRRGFARSPFRPTVRPSLPQSRRQRRPLPVTCMFDQKKKKGKSPEKKHSRCL